MELDPEENLEQLKQEMIRHLTGNLSERIGRLCAEVLSRLPAEWDAYRTFNFLALRGIVWVTFWHFRSPAACR